jgi:hypothetical protein
MKMFKSRFSIAVLIGVILLLMAGWLYLWAATAVEVHFHQCNAGFRLDSAEWACRRPAILVYAAVFAFVGSVIAFGVALFLRLRKKRTL